MNAGLALKQYNLDLIESGNGTWLESMRGEARRIARRNGTVCADDLRQYAEKLQTEHNVFPTSKNAWGAVFKIYFELVGFRASEYPSNHGRRVSVWKLRPEQV